MIDLKNLSDRLTCREDGIWYSTDSQPVSFPIDGNQTCYQLEESSFWFKHRNICIASVVKQFPPENNKAIFDIGGGNGYVSLGLQKEGFETVLVEPGQDGASNAKRRGIDNVICGSAESAGIKHNSLSAVGLFDVIEHIEDDLKFMQNIAKLLEKGGMLYATVPAYQFLWSIEDSAGGHHRRYTLTSFSDLLKAAGFDIEFSTYFFRFLPLPIFLLRALPYKLGLARRELSEVSTKRAHIAKEGLITRVHSRLLRSEVSSIQQKKSLLFGGSCLIAAKKT